ncbi:Ribonuclease III [Macleaya cordata]|uniref:Ribonuclease III n=1 Tax=Macleaya cordata TaxID=56857 RepID=A0A200PUG4_MACCD|nr:Ribonuclease III [Macleaya cordata]
MLGSGGIEKDMSNSNGFAGVSNCYVFKSRLQEYAQKEGLPTPVYETLKEGPSHEPCFRSSVIVNDVKYDSLPGFFNRKAAEQSAAEIALLEIAKLENKNESIKNPVHETGLCKNLLQEYAQKMNYAIPSYVCQKDETPGKMASFSCTVDIGGIQYIGAAARTKKEAEIKAARTALLAIQSITGGSDANPSGNSQLTVVPCKKKGAESNTPPDQTKKPLKPKKANFKKKWSKKKFTRNNGDQVKNNPTAEVAGNTENAAEIQVQDSGMLEVNKNVQGMLNGGSENENGAGRLAIEANKNFQESWQEGSKSQIEQGFSNAMVLSGLLESATNSAMSHLPVDELKQRLGDQFQVPQLQ